MRKGYLTPPVLIILGLITFFVAATIFINSYLKKSAKNQSASTSQTPSTIATDSSNGRAIQPLGNDKYRVVSNLCNVSFEFMQPSPNGSEWEFQEYRSNYASIFENTAQLYIADNDPHGPAFEVICAENNDNLNLEQLFSIFQTRIESNYGRLGSKKTEKVGGFMSFNIKMLEEVELEKPYDFHLAVVGGKIYLIRGLPDTDGKFLPIFNQILSTFRFE